MTTSPRKRKRGGKGKNESSLRTEESVAIAFLDGILDDSDDAHNPEEMEEVTDIHLDGDFGSLFDFNVFRDFVYSRTHQPVLNDVQIVTFDNNNSDNVCQFSNFPTTVHRYTFKNVVLAASNVEQLCGDHVREIVIQNSRLDVFPDFSFCDRLTNIRMENVDVNNYQLDISGRSLPPQVNSVVIRNTNLKSFPTINSNSILTELDLHGTPIDRAPLVQRGNYPKLLKVDFSKTLIKDLSVISKIKLALGNTVNLADVPFENLMEINGNARITHISTDNLIPNAQNTTILRTYFHVDSNKKIEALKRLKQEGRELVAVNHMVHNQMMENADVASRVMGFLDRDKTRIRKINVASKGKRKLSPEPNRSAKTSRTVGGRRTERKRRKRSV